MLFIIVKSISEGSEGKSTFKLFDIAVDGEYLCSIRYSILYQLQDEIKKSFPTATLPDFPPKKILALDAEQLDGRRFGIEKYLQGITLVPQIASSPLFKNFLLAAQFASWDGTADPTPLLVYLLNGKTVELKQVTALERADLVLERVAKEMNLHDDLVYYFALHIVLEEEDGSFTVVRRLYDMESPVITLNRAGSKTRLVVMRRFWHKAVHTELCQDKTGRNLLYLEGVHAIEKGQWRCREEEKKAISKAHQKNQKKEFLELVSTQPGYLSTVVEGLTIVIDSVEYEGHVVVGQQDLLLHHRLKEEGVAGGGEDSIYRMQLSRVRCWKMAYLRDRQCLSLALHYLVSKTKLDWVFVTGKQVAYLAQCIQNVVTEIVRITQKKPLRKPSEDDVGIIPTFTKVNRREIPQPQYPRKVPAAPKTHKESASKQQQQQQEQQQQQREEQEQQQQRQQQQQDERKVSTSSAKEAKPETPSSTETAEGEDLSEPKQLTSVDDTDPPPQSPKVDTPSNGLSNSQGNTDPPPQDHPDGPPAESSSKRSKPPPSAAAAPQPPPQLLNVAELDEEGGSRSIGSMLKKLTHFRSNEVSNDVFDQVYGDEDL